MGATLKDATRVDRTFLALAAVAAFAYLLLGAKTYPGEALLKASMCMVLALLAGRHGKWILCAALLFSALGDALLSVDRTRLFVPALIAFLVTHVLYAAIFVRAAQLRFMDLRQWRRLLLVVIPVFVTVYTTILWPRLGALTLPVTFYIAAIATMTVLSLRVPVVWVPVGAVLFLISDSLIALGKFLWQANGLGAAIWITYAAAQLCIVTGLLRRPSVG